MKNSTLEEAFVNFTGFLDRADYEFSESRLTSVAQSGALLRAEYDKRKEEEGIDIFFRELPDFDDIRTGINYKLAQALNPDLEVNTLIEEGDSQKAEALLYHLIASSAKGIGDEEHELRKDAHRLKTVLVMRDKETYDAWQNHLEGGRDDYGKLAEAVGGAAEYLGAMAEICGASDQEKAVAKNLTNLEKLKAVVNHEDKRKTIDRKIAAYITKKDINEEDGEEVVKEVIDYLKSAVRIYGIGEGFEELETQAAELKEKRAKLAKKTEEDSTSPADIANYVEGLFSLKRNIDSYGNLNGYVNTIKAVVDSVRNIQLGEESKEYLDALSELDMKTTESIEKKMSKAADRLKSTWHYMQGSLEPGKVDPSNINFQSISERKTEDIPESQREYAYLALAKDRDHLNRFEAETKEISRRAKIWADDGEQIEAAVLVELGEFFEDQAYPLEAYSEAYPNLAEFISLEEISRGETDLAERLDVDKKKLDRILGIKKKK